MTDDELQRHREQNEMLWIERDAGGWIHMKLHEPVSVQGSGQVAGFKLTMAKIWK